MLSSAAIGNLVFCPDIHPSPYLSSWSTAVSPPPCNSPLRFLSHIIFFLLSWHLRFDWTPLNISPQHLNVPPVVPVDRITNVSDMFISAHPLPFFVNTDKPAVLFYRLQLQFRPSSCKEALYLQCSPSRIPRFTLPDGGKGKVDIRSILADMIVSFRSAGSVL